MNSIDKRQIKEKQKVIEMLQKIPIVQIVCEKTGISRPTYYRWRKRDKLFTQQTDNAITQGNDIINDLAESQLISAIREKNLGAIALWLRHHHPAYANKLEVSGKLTEEYHLNPEQEKLMIKALTMLQKSKI